MSMKVVGDVDYAPSLSSSLAPSSNTESSSLTSGVTVPSSPIAPSIFTLSTTSTTSTTAHSTNNLKDLFKMDFSTLLRSHSTHSKSAKRHSVPLSDQADVVQLAVVDGIQESEMSEHVDSERPTRKKSKSENRFYHFLTRSRSRSSKRTTSVPEVAADAMPDFAQDHDQSIHSRNSSWSSAASSQRRPMSSTTASTSKPSNILQSRPISSTTTATNTTVTPPTLRAKRQAQSPIPEPSTSSDSPALPHKSSSTARQRLNHIFGRKPSTSSSRATSPGRSNPNLAEIYPVPDVEEAEYSTPRLTRKSRSRPTSPSPLLPRSRQSSSEPSTSTSHSHPNSAPASKLENLFKPTKLFSSSRRAQSPPPALSFSQSNNVNTPLHTPSSPQFGSSMPTAVVSGPSRQIARRRASTNESISSSSIHRVSHAHTPQPQSRSSAATGTSLPAIPRITHTPATPSRSGTAPPRLSSTHRKDSIDSGYRYRPLAMDMVDEERDSKELDIKGKGKETSGLTVSRSSSKGKESENSSSGSGQKSTTHHSHSSHHGQAAREQPIKPKKSNLPNIRSTKHGSFDFERPVWSGGLLARSLSGTSGNSGVTGFSGGRHSNRSGESVGITTRGNVDDKHKKPAKGSSKREEHASQKRGQDREDDPAPPYSPIAAGPGKGLSSSLGRGTAKRTGIARLIGIGGFASHGPFAFEPPVPSPTFSHSEANPRSNGRPDAANDDKLKARERERRRKEKERSKTKEIVGEKEKTRDRDRHAEKDHAGISSYPGVASRAGKKGRSLDLGIGLSWAPTKVPADVLLPVGVFANGKAGLNGSAPSRNGLSDSTSSRFGWSGNGAGRVRYDEFGMEDRSKVGKDTADMFKNALDQEGYAAFKRYVHQFDAHELPFDGPTGIIARAQRLLDRRSTLGEESKRELMDRLVKIVLQNA